MATRNNIVENVLDAQKKAADNVVETTKKFTGNNKALNETIEKGNDWYKNWLETQKEMFSKFTGATANGNTADKSAKSADSTAATGEFLQGWFEAQADYARKMWEMGQDSAKKFGFDMNQNPFAAWTNNNPFTSWQNMNTTNNPWAAWMNQMTANNWMNQWQSMNPFTPEAFKKASDNMASMFNQYYSTLNSNVADWQKSFQDGTLQDAYKNMINTAEGFTKFAEMWMPMIKSMQEKTFSMDEYKKLMNPELYKEFMDKFFGFMPESTREYMNKMSGMAGDNLKKMTDAGMDGYHQFRDAMNRMNNAPQMFSNINNAYTSLYNQVSEAAAPFTKLMTPNQYTKLNDEWSNISNRIVEFNMKNAELQYMIYNQGAKVMDKLAEHTAKKIKEGAEITSILDLYQEWLNISDKVYVSLFESSDYSELMAEVGAMQMKLRKDMELQMESMFKDVPVATRSQMDDVYKTIYELKKKVRQLEKMLDMDEEEVEVKPAAKKTAAKKTGRK